MTDSNEIKPKGMGRGTKVLLGVSLAINLAVAGMVAGAVMRHDGFPDRDKRGPELGAFGAPYMRALPKETRRELFTQMRADAGNAFPDRKARRALFRDVLDSLRASPFDPAALEALLARQASTTVQVQQAAQAAWMKVVSEMSDAERATYADAVEESLKTRRKPKKQ